ncbi:helix-turn-helix transcriptional regulator [Gorillibacterium timonense]|uniref:helix-turn-helix transcriptional regulator n=1 Tax=Gorillibacterium timonense TaxID=1689269 RepID=UPI00071C5EB7|nr:YafY family protein [Gorillibacterium timonense]
MKLDRLLGITIYMLNRGKVNARLLAEKFEVSQRTIQRDMEALNLAGIPVVSTYGTDGGYEILDTFRMDRLLADDSDSSFILTALKGLATAYVNPRLESALAKAQALHKGKPGAADLILDFSVLRENPETQERLSIIREAIARKSVVAFDYAGQSGLCRRREVEPVVLTYKWYAWYLFAYCTDVEDYRLFKLVRMDKLSVTRKQWQREHDEPERLLARHTSAESGRYLELKLLCKAEAKSAVLEYLNGRVEVEGENGEVIVTARVLEEERVWYGMLVGLGGKVKVLEPERIKQKLRETAHDILAVNGE